MGHRPANVHAAPTDGVPDFADLAAFLHGLLLADRYPDDPAGVWWPGEGPVRALGLLLEGWPGLPAWVAAERLAALVVHRPWWLPEAGLEGVGVLAYHLAFDERLTLGFNPTLAAALGLRDPAVLGRKAGRPIGMLGDVPPRDPDAFVADLAREFGGLDAVLAGDGREVGCVAVVGAMTEALVREAAVRGADAYVTGQVRQPALAAVAELGLPVVAVGHRRSERWGLRALGAALRGRWPGLRVAVRP